MRGLDTRVLLANTRILFFVNAAAANEQMERVRKLAEHDGWIDAANGYQNLPLMFADEPNLAYNWDIGQQKFAEEKRFDDLQEALCTGYNDWRHGVTDAPAAYLADPEMLKHWNQGQDEGLREDILSACEDCHNPDGLPCRMHG